jgi:hypothetical protein
MKIVPAKEKKNCNEAKKLTTLFSSIFNIIVGE